MARASISRFFHFRARLDVLPALALNTLIFNALIFIALLPLSLSAQTGAAPQQVSVRQGVVQKVEVRETGDGTEVVIQTSGAAVSPNTQAISGPDRIVVDFPGATPSAALRALKVNHGALKGVRSGLFFSNPPITRVVLDLTGPQSYKISTSDHATVVKLARAGVDDASAAPAVGARVGGARLREAALDARSQVAAAHISPASLAGAAPKGAVELGESAVSLKRYPDTKQNAAGSAAAGSGAVGSATARSAVALSAAAASPQMTALPLATAPALVIERAQPPQPVLLVTYENGLLRIQADKATLSQVLYEVHLRTQAEIAIPAGAEQEKVVADLGPAPARDVLAELLNGSDYNFIFVGDELSLQRVILTRRTGF